MHTRRATGHLSGVDEGVQLEGPMLFARDRGQQARPEGVKTLPADVVPCQMSLVIRSCHSKTASEACRYREAQGY